MKEKTYLISLITLIFSQRQNEHDQNNNKGKIHLWYRLKTGRH